MKAGRLSGASSLPPRTEPRSPGGRAGDALSPGLRDKTRRPRQACPPATVSDWFLHVLPRTLACRRSSVAFGGCAGTCSCLGPAVTGIFFTPSALPAGPIVTDAPSPNPPAPGLDNGVNPSTARKRGARRRVSFTHLKYVFSLMLIQEMNLLGFINYARHWIPASLSLRRLSGPLRPRGCHCPSVGGFHTRTRPRERSFLSSFCRSLPGVSCCEEFRRHRCTGMCVWSGFLETVPLWPPLAPSAALAAPVSVGRRGQGAEPALGACWYPWEGSP